MSKDCVCSPIIEAEMADWEQLGGTNSGCCGNARHVYGFHLPADDLPPTDYSRRRDPHPPFNPHWACAGDFAHNRNPRLLSYHRTLLARLVRGELPMICEFIGSPWPGKPAYYWARWQGSTIKRYTGVGHDTWSHISWWRSRAGQRAGLWTGPTPAAPTPAPAGTIPAYPGHPMSFSAHPHFDPGVKTWQQRMTARGWHVDTDGLFGPNTRRVVLAFQNEKHLAADGIIGPHTWSAAWTMPVTH